MSEKELYYNSNALWAIRNVCQHTYIFTPNLLSVLNIMLTINPVEKPEYRRGNTYYCNRCQSYKQDFYHSAIKARSRRCKECQNQQDKARKERDPLCRLIRQVYQSLYRRDLKSVARALRKEHLEALLRAHHVDNVDEVKGIVPYFKEPLDLSKYQIVLDK